MTDERLRELERRWKESGSVEDEAVYLLERVRMGELTQKQLELLAYAEQPGARAALDAPRPPWDLVGWIRGLLPFGKLGSRAACVVAFAAACAGDREPTGRSAVFRDAGLAWANCPCPEHARVVAQHIEDSPYLQCDSPEVLCALHVAHYGARRSRRKCIRQARIALSAASGYFNPRVPYGELRQVVLSSLREWTQEHAGEKQPLPLEVPGLGGEL